MTGTFPFGLSKFTRQAVITRNMFLIIYVLVTLGVTESTVFDRTGQGITDSNMTSGFIPSGTTIADLSTNVISTFNAEVFNNAYNLTELLLNFNQIAVVSAEMFNTSSLGKKLYSAFYVTVGSDWSPSGYLYIFQMNLLLR